MTNESLHVFNITKILNERSIDFDANITIGRLNVSKEVNNETEVSAIDWHGQVKDGQIFGFGRIKAEWG